MNKLLLASPVGLLMIVMSGCAADAPGESAVEAPNVGEHAEEQGTPDPYTYEVDGAPSSAEDVKALSARGTVLRYLMPSDENDRTVHVFTTDAGLEKITSETSATLKPQAFCISTRTRTWRPKKRSRRLAAKHLQRFERTRSYRP